MTIKTKRVYDKPSEDDGYRICIMRFPYWINPAFKEFQEHKERWMPILAPSALLLKSYKTNAISWDTFAERYNTDINNNPNAIKLVQELRDRSKTETITLLCQEIRRRSVLS